MDYIYSDLGYKFLSLHRKVIEYDPKNTDNLIILDYFNSIQRIRNNATVYYDLIDSHIKNIQFDVSIYPLSFQMILHEINLSWVDIIHQMLFIDGMYDTFHGEYKTIIENIILYDTIDEKETLVYRYHNTGVSIFHIAGKMWLYEKWFKSKESNQDINMKDELEFVLNSYKNLEYAFGSNRRFCILYLMDFSGKTLVDYLYDFLYELQE